MTPLEKKAVELAERVVSFTIDREYEAAAVLARLVQECLKGAIAERDAKKQQRGEG